MTREEVIKALIKERKTALHKNKQAFDMAIKALEQEPSEDCVSRTQAIEFVNEVIGGKNDLADAIRDGVEAVLSALPPVTPTQRWIPVSERLPEEDGDYLLFGKVDEDEENYIFVGEYDSCGEQFGIWVEQFDRTTLGCLGSEFYEYASVLAWMPLPEPYKAEMESEE